MTVESRTTMANANTVKQRKNYPTTIARRLAAALEQNDPVVDRVVTTRPASRVDAAVVLDSDSGPAAFRPPEGWAIESAFVTSAGEVHIRVQLE